MSPLDLPTWYEPRLARGQNPARWIEYAFLSGVMIVVVANLTGIRETGTLAAIFGARAEVTETDLFRDLQFRTNDLRGPARESGHSPRGRHHGGQGRRATVYVSSPAGHARGVVVQAGPADRSARQTTSQDR